MSPLFLRLSIVRILISKRSNSYKRSTFNVIIKNLLLATSAILIEEHFILSTLFITTLKTFRREKKNISCKISTLRERAIKNTHTRTQKFYSLRITASTLIVNSIIQFPGWIVLPQTKDQILLL